MNFAAVAKGKTGSMYSSKEKSGFCSKEKSGFCSIAEENQLFITGRKKVNFAAVAKEKPVMCMAVRRKVDFAAVAKKTGHI